MSLHRAPSLWHLTKAFMCRVQRVTPTKWIEGPRGERLVPTSPADGSGWRGSDLAWRLSSFLRHRRKNETKKKPLMWKCYCVFCLLPHQIFCEHSAKLQLMQMKIKAGFCGCWVIHGTLGSPSIWIERVGGFWRLGLRVGNGQRKTEKHGREHEKVRAVQMSGHP